MEKSSTEYIRIGSHKFPRHRSIASNSTFFKDREDYVFSVSEESMIIRRPTIDHKGKTYRATKSTDGWVTLTITAELPLGKFEIDAEDSDVDMIVVYFNE